MILGLGTDLVAIQPFAEQLEASGTQFLKVFTGAERRAVARRARVTGNEAEHFAARWAAKEAFVKAWSAALYGKANPISEEDLEWKEIEVVAGALRRPSLRLSGTVHDAVHEGLGEICIHVSMSHDAGYATATVIVESRSIRRSTESQ